MFEGAPYRQALSQVVERQHEEHRLTAALGDAVRHARAGRSWTQRELADAAGVHVNVVGSVERGLSVARIDTLEAIAVALGTTGSALLAAAEGDGHG